MLGGSVYEGCLTMLCFVGVFGEGIYYFNRLFYTRGECYEREHNLTMDCFAIGGNVLGGNIIQQWIVL